MEVEGPVRSLKYTRKTGVVQPHFVRLLTLGAKALPWTANLHGFPLGVTGYNGALLLLDLLALLDLLLHGLLDEELGGLGRLLRARAPHDPVRGPGNRLLALAYLRIHRQRNRQTE